MFLKGKILAAAATASATIVFSSFALAQDKPAVNQSQNPPMQQTNGNYGKKGNGKHAGHGSDKFLMRGVEQLNLSGAQKQQTDAVFEKYRTAFSSADRVEMRALAQKKRDGSIAPDEENRLKNIKRQFKTSSEQMRGEILAILTPEQKQQLQQAEAAMQNKADERRQNKTAQNPPQDN